MSRKRFALHHKKLKTVRGADGGCTSKYKSTENLSYGRAVYRTSNIAERTLKSGKHEIKRLNRPSETKAPKRVSQGKRRRED